jgi:hypothetical protein
MMEEAQKIQGAEDGVDETLVTPRFDEAESVTAQPVVPLAVVSTDEPVEAFDAGMPPYVVRRRGQKHLLPLALVLVSALVGSVFGGAGFYLYQKRQQQKANAQAATTTPEQTSSADTSAQPAAAQMPEAVNESSAAAPAQLPETSDAGNIEVSATRPDVAESEHDDEDRAGDDLSRADERAKISDAATRKASEESQTVGVVKRGKKGDRVEDDNPVVRREQHPRRATIEPRPARPEDDRGGDEPEARRIDTIIYPRERRRGRGRERRGGEGRVVDRVRGIFEGQPR